MLTRFSVLVCTPAGSKSPSWQGSLPVSGTLATGLACALGCDTAPRTMDLRRLLQSRIGSWPPWWPCDCPGRCPKLGPAAGGGGRAVVRGGLDPMSSLPVLSLPEQCLAFSAPGPVRSLVIKALFS